MLLKIPDPYVIDHAPVVALPPTLAPDNGIAAGKADWQVLSVLPAVTVATAATVTVTVGVICTLHPVVAFVARQVLKPSEPCRNILMKKNQSM